MLPGSGLGRWHRAAATLLLAVAGCSADGGLSGPASDGPTGGVTGSGGSTAAGGAVSSGGSDGFLGFDEPPPPEPEPVPGTSCNQDVDVVFVVDVSGSMIPPLTFLQEEVGLVDAALQSKNLPSAPHYGLVIFVDDVVVMNGGAPYPDVTAFAAAVANEIVTTNALPTRQAAAGGESNATWPENSLDALYAAATTFQWRPVDTTLRTIIHITDASFWDLDRVSSAAGDPNGLEPAGACSVSILSLPPPGGCLMTFSIHSYDETIQALRDQGIWVNTFAAKTGGPPTLTLAPPSHGAFRGVEVNVGIGFFEPYDGRNSIAVSTGGLAWDIDEVFDGIISLADPINQSIEDRQCVEYPPPPPPPDIR